MADTRISDLTAATSVDGTEVVPIVQSATTKKSAISTIKTYITGTANTFTAAQTVPSMKFAGSSSGEVTIQPAAAAGTYTLTLPTNDGDASQVLTTNGSGVLSWTTPSAGATPGGSDTQVQFNDGGSALGGDSGLTFNKTTDALTVAGTVSTPTLTLSGNISQAAWTTSGVKLKGGGSTLTDTSSSGTVALSVTDRLGGNTIAASSATTFTNYASLYVETPTAGTNVTITNPWSAYLTGALRATKATLATGTIATDQPAVDVTQTWNAGAVTFTGLRVNVTDTASASASLLADWQIGGTSYAYLKKTGEFRAGSSTNYWQLNQNTNNPSLTVRVSNGNVGTITYNDGYGFTVNAGNNGGGDTAFIGLSGVRLKSGGTFRWNANANDLNGTEDLFLARDAANALAQRNGTNAQASRIYSTYTAADNYQRLTITSASTTLSALSGATVTATALIPDGAVVVGVTTRVSTLITGATGYQIGTVADPDRWGDITGTAVGTTSDNRDWTAGTIECFTSASDVVLTAKGSNFTAGAIVVTVHYLAGQAD